MCSKTEFRTLICAQKRRRLKLQVLFCTKNYHTIGAIYTCGYYRKLDKTQNLPSNTDIIESYTRDGANSKWKVYKLTNVTIFVALLREIPMGCSDTVLPDRFRQLLNIRRNSRKPYKLCPFKALAFAWE